MPRDHKKVQRLFVSADLRQGAVIELGKDAANYLANVLRKREGDLVILFNGRDGAWMAELVEASRKSVSVSVMDCVAEQPTPIDLWYGFAPLKSARLDYMVQKATEMGVSAIQPVLTEYTQVTRFNEDRARANIIEAAEQCEVLQVPDLLSEVKLDRLLSEWQTTHAQRVLFFADESAPSASPVETLAAHHQRPLGLIIGPEGGFSDRERQLLLARSFVVPISLGPRILRADTAAVAALAVIQSIIGDWR